MRLPISIQIILILVLLGVNYFLFLFRGNSEKIIKKYSTESRQARVIGTIIGYTYVFITIVFLLIAKQLQFN